MMCKEYTEEICSFGMNTINIFFLSSVFSRVGSTVENLNVFITRDENIYDIYRKKQQQIFS